MPALLRVSTVVLPALVVSWASTSRADDGVLERAQAAQAQAKARGPLRVPTGEGAPECFVPKHLDGAACAKGLQLCRAAMSSGSCDGWSNETISLLVRYEGEPDATQLGVNGDQGGMPFFEEAGPDLEFERMQCGAVAIGGGRLGVRADASEEQKAAIEALNRKNAEAAERENEQAKAACLRRADAEVKRQRKWQRCELLSVDACRREAFLQCRGNVGQRGLLRATWSRPKDRPANETLTVRAVPKK